MVNKHYSPLRYPGGKSSLYDFLKGAINKNDIIDGAYAECYAGGAGAALKLLLFEDVHTIYLNDKDSLIYKFWHSVLNNTEDIVKKIYDTRVSYDEWVYRRKVLRDEEIQKGLSDIELGFTAFFLNRCNRSGILNAGAIGGVEQTGDWKIDARYNKQDLIKRIELISLYKDRIILSNYDALSFLKMISKKGYTEKELLVYLDPPYVIQGKELYRHYYTKSDHVKLGRYLQQTQNLNWILSYDDDPLIHQIFTGTEKNIFEFKYYANKTKIGRELIIKSANCKIPNSYQQYSQKKKLEFYLESIHREAV